MPEAQVLHHKSLFETWKEKAVFFADFLQVTQANSRRPPQGRQQAVGLRVQWLIPSGSTESSFKRTELTVEEISPFHFWLSSDA